VRGLSGINRKGYASAVAIVVIILTITSICPNTLAQTNTAFGPATKFNLPAYDGSINFAANGTYTSAMFEDNKWVFTNLHLNRSQLLGNLEVSAENSNITIYSYRATTVNFPSDRLTYFALGKGEQVINMGVGPHGGSSVDWVVISNGTFLSTGWSVSHNGTVTVTGLTGNISVIYFGFTNQLANSHLPFYEQHSVAIAVTVAVAATLGVAVVVKVEVRRREGKGVERNV
jgi:hypothetical protein